jgi:hypothetical protein
MYGTELRRGLLSLEIIDPLEIEPRAFVQALMDEVLAKPLCLQH